MANKGLSEETTQKHPSYGMVGINRTSSSGTWRVREASAFVSMAGV